MDCIDIFVGLQQRRYLLDAIPVTVQYDDLEIAVGGRVRLQVADELPIIFNRRVDEDDLARPLFVFRGGNAVGIGFRPAVVDITVDGIVTLFPAVADNPFHATTKSSARPTPH